MLKPSQKMASTFRVLISRVGDVARFVCSPGHVMEGQPMAACQEEGAWATKESKESTNSMFFL